MKKIIWLGQTHEEILRLPKKLKQKIGYALDRLQRGLKPIDWKPLNTVGPGVKEIRIHAWSECRLIYVDNFRDRIYILHFFKKKSQKITKKDLALVKKRYCELLEV